MRKLQNFGARSYRFAVASRVFHAHHAHWCTLPACGGGRRAKRGGWGITRAEAPPPQPSPASGGGDDRAGQAQRVRQLTCRSGAPKTRHQFRPSGAKNAAFREKIDARCIRLRCRANPDRPLWRFVGQSARRRSGGSPDQGVDGAPSEARLVRSRRGLFRLRQPGRRGQPQRGADGAVAGGPAGDGSRPDAEPALRLGAGCGGRRGPRDPRRRDRFRHRRRRRIDDAGAVRDGQGGGSVFALGRDFRHHHRLALHQSR